MSFLVLLRKDLLLEAKGKEMLGVMLPLSILLSVVVSSGVGSAFLPPAGVERLYPACLWVVFVMTGTLTLERSNDPELREKAFEGVMSTGVSLSTVYLSKVASGFLLTSTVQLFSATLLAVLLNVGAGRVAGPLMLLTFLVVLGFCALGVLTSAMTGAARLRASLLPLVLLPLLFPLFFAAVELTSALLASGNLPAESPWLSLLIGLDVVYLALGINLYPHVLSE